MASTGTVPCIGETCNKRVYLEADKPPLCQLHARAVLSEQAVANSREQTATTKAKQKQFRYSGKKWQKEMQRRSETRLRQDMRAQEAELASAIRRTPQPRIHGARFKTNHPLCVSESVSSSRYSPSPLRSMPNSIYNTVSGAIGSRMSAPSALRRSSRDDSVDLATKVSKTGRVRKAGFIVEDDDDELPLNPIGSMAPPHRPLKQNVDKYNKEDKRIYDYEDDDGDDLPESAINFIKSLPRPTKERPGTRKYKEREIDDELTGFRSHGDYSAHARKTSQRELMYSRHERLVDSNEAVEPAGYEEIKRSMRGRSKRASHSSQQIIQLKKNRDAKRRNEEPEPQIRTKRIRFKSNVLAEFGEAEAVQPPKKSYQVPKTVKAMLPPLEIFEDTDPTAQFTVGKSESLGVPDDDSALVHDVESEAETESVMSEKTLPLKDKMRMWYGVPVTGDEDKANLEKRARISKPTPAAQSVAQTEATLTRFQRGMLKNQSKFPSVAKKQPQTHSMRQPTRPQPVLSENEPDKGLPRVLLPKYQPFNADLIPSYMVTDAGESGSSTSYENSSGRSVFRIYDSDPLALLQELPNAIKCGTLQPTTPQQVSKHGTPMPSRNSTPGLGKEKTDSIRRKVPTRDTRPEKRKNLPPTQPNVPQNFFDPDFRANYEEDAIMTGERDTDGYSKHWSLNRRLKAHLNDDTEMHPPPNVPTDDEQGRGAQKENIVDVDLPKFIMDYPVENDGVDSDTQMFDLVAAMDSGGNIMDDRAPQSGGFVAVASVSTNKTALPTISAKALRAFQGLPADSPLNDHVMLDFAARVQHGTLEKSMPPTNEQTQENDEEAQISHQLTMEEFESKKKRYGEEKEKLTKMTEMGEDVSKQKMVVRLVAKRLEKFVAQNGLQYSREKMMFE